MLPEVGVREVIPVGDDKVILRVGGASSEQVEKLFGESMTQEQFNRALTDDSTRIH
jgi:hypothetical protein